MQPDIPCEYEYHKIRDPDFPAIFHVDALPEGHSILTHWHENLELLWITQGRAAVCLDGVPVNAGQGDLVIIDSNRLHQISGTETLRYYCLIVDKDFCGRFGIPVGEIRLQPYTSDPELQNCYERIVREMAEKPPYYKAAAQANILLLLTQLYRSFPDHSASQDTASPQTGQLAMVRRAIDYLNRSYQRPLTIDEICREVGSSKFHFCRVFRAVTGKTVVDYLNFLRCEKAQYMLSAGLCSVRESAERCGFSSDSYFSKIYKRQIGEVPSATIKRAAQRRRFG